MYAVVGEKGEKDQRERLLIKFNNQDDAAEVCEKRLVGATHVS